MSDLRIQPLPPETLAAQRQVIDPARSNAVAPAAATPSNANGGGTAGSGDAPRDQYISPFISIDPTSGLVITQYRNSETGQLQKQYPTEKAVREYRNLQPAAVAVSGGRGGVPADGTPAAAATAGAAPARAAAPVPGGQSQAQAPAPAPAPAAAPSPAPQPAAPAPTGGVDKGSA